MRKLTRYSVLAAAVLFGVNCGGGDDGNEPNDPTPGNLTLAYSSPNNDDGALKLTITGPAAPTAITSVDSDNEVFRTGLGTTTTVIVARSLAGGAIGEGQILLVAVPDTREADEYSVTVTEAASATFAQRSTAGYTATLDAE